MLDLPSLGDATQVERILFASARPRQAFASVFVDKIDGLNVALVTALSVCGVCRCLASHWWKKNVVLELQSLNALPQHPLTPVCARCVSRKDSFLKEKKEKNTRVPTANIVVVFFTKLFRQIFQNLKSVFHVKIIVFCEKIIGFNLFLFFDGVENFEKLWRKFYFLMKIWKRRLIRVFLSSSRPKNQD
jgi:hypothetical protein